MTNPQQYRQVRQRLDEPREQIFDPLDVPLLPEDPEWPTPRTAVEIKRLLQRLPHKAQVLCAVVAAEMALPVWEESYPENNLPKLTLQAIHAWLKTEGSMEEVQQLNQRLHNAIYEAEGEYHQLEAEEEEEEDYRLAVLAAGDAVEQAAFIVYFPVGRTEWALLATIGVERAARALDQYDYHPTPQFLRRWWSRCRQLLAFKDVETAEVSGQRSVGTRQGSTCVGLNREQLLGPGTHRVYHATDRQFSDFRYPEIGFHFAANPNLAVNAAIKSGKRDPVAYAYDITLQNPVEISGQPNRFPAFRVLDDLLDRDIIDAEEHDVAMDQYDEMEATLWADELQEESAKLIQNLVKPKGIDSFTYWNEFDAGYNILGTGPDVEPDWSFIVFDNSQIGSAK